MILTTNIDFALSEAESSRCTDLTDIATRTTTVRNSCAGGGLQRSHHLGLFTACLACLPIMVSLFNDLPPNENPQPGCSGAQTNHWMIVSWTGSYKVITVTK